MATAVCPKVTLMMTRLSVRAPQRRQILICYSIDSSHTFTFLGHPVSDSTNDSEGAEEEQEDPCARTTSVV